jgi:serine/threonine-protein kinase
VVHLAVPKSDPEGGKLVVLKRMRPDRARDRDFAKRFEAEARVAARMGHANVVSTWGVMHDAEGPTIVMEYLSGEVLSRVLRQAHEKRQRRSLRLHLTVLYHAIQGLHHAHTVTDDAGVSLKLVHRDVSPQNIFITHDGEVKLLDFGIAKASTSEVHTQTGLIRGKFGYLSPEQVVRMTVDARSDVFAAGILIWEAVAGRGMWAGATDPEIVQALSAGNIPLLAQYRPDAPEELRDICSRALAPNPENRYPSAAALAAELHTYLGSIGGLTEPAQIARFMKRLFETERDQAEAQILELRQAVVRGDSSRGERPTSNELPRLSALPPEPRVPSISPKGTQTWLYVSLGLLALTMLVTLVWFTK